ncbi:GtrA family protein [Litchfieldia salsa]|uniref:Putative flippase GtrA (Transmembrane translocase of bactoprenol-linked glucose) n=1 Tax=Litchfieldia salsa TaxID=930152 RepID=A0A1H0PLF8_9BACI|nr:GtrA family protein [Litchfieldia salsa]SDP05620.1 Putative flippase GtrA (transmembrane translocase of bactoprenol-linked glucose) [Litchfieldia salsa]
MNNKKEIINYLIFGVLTTAINIISFWILDRLVGLDYRLATSIAWILSVIFAFVTNKLYVFNSIGKDVYSVIKEFSSFIFFRLLSYALDLITMIMLVESIQMDSLYAKVLANVLVVIFNYFASKFIIFKTLEK